MSVTWHLINRFYRKRKDLFERAADSAVPDCKKIRLILLNGVPIKFLCFLVWFFLFVSFFLFAFFCTHQIKFLHGWFVAWSASDSCFVFFWLYRKLVHMIIIKSRCSQEFLVQHSSYGHRCVLSQYLITFSRTPTVFQVGKDNYFHLVKLRDHHCLTF